MEPIVIPIRTVSMTSSGIKLSGKKVVGRTILEEMHCKVSLRAHRPLLALQPGTRQVLRCPPLSCAMPDFDLVQLWSWLSSLSIFTNEYLASISLMGNKVLRRCSSID